MRKIPGASWLAIVVLGAVGAVCSIHRLYDPDVFWHLRAGEWISQHGAFPSTDPFSFSAEGPWRYSEVLGELLFFGLSKLGGLAAVVVGMAVISGAFVGATGFLVATTARVAVTPLAVTLAWVAIGSSIRQGPKMDVFSFVAFALQSWLLLANEPEGKARRLYGIVPLMLLWGNLHRGATLGLGVLLLVGSVRWAKGATRREVWSFVSVAVLSTLALGANRGGFWYFTSSVGLLTSPEYARWLPEWAPASLDYLGRVNPAFSIAIVVWLFSKLERRSWDAEMAVGCVCIVLALRSTRMVPFAMIAMAPELARFCATALARAAHSVWGIAVGVAMVFGQFLVSVPVSLWGTDVLEWRIPVAAANFLRKHPPAGRMWNSFDYGGYLMYALPNSPVFIDGRNDTVYSARFFDQAMRASRDLRALLEQWEQYRIGFAVIKCTALVDPAFAWLKGNPEWQLVYLDDLVAIVVRRSAQSAEYLQRFGYEELNPSDALVRVTLRTNMPREATLVREILRNAEESPQSLRAVAMQALVLRAQGQSGAYLAARAAIEQLASERGVVVPLP